MIWKQLKIAYSPRENFGLRDFHHAVNSLPSDVFLAQTGHPGPASSAGLSFSFFFYSVLFIYFHSKSFIYLSRWLLTDLQLSTILSDGVLYSWGGKDIARKVILLSSCLDQNIDSTLQNTLMVRLQYQSLDPDFSK